MRIISSLIINKTAAGSIMALAAIALLGSCKGRTLDNVEPNGETIDVVIPETEPETEDAVEIPVASPETAIPEANEPKSDEGNDSMRSAPLQFQNF